MVRKENIGFAAALVCVAAVGAQSYRSASALVEAAGEQDATRARAQAIEGVLSTLKDAETGQRGYLLTGNPRYLDPFDAAQAALQAQLARLRSAFPETQLSSEAMRHIQQLADVKMHELQRTVALRKSGDREAALAIVQSDVGHETMVEARRVLGTLAAAQEVAIEHQVAAVAAQVRSSVWFIGAGSALAFALVAIASIITNQDRGRLLQVEAELTVANRVAREAAETKALFLATMSHEIRTPLNGVTGMTDLLLETSLTAEQRQYADVAHRSAMALLALVNDILDFSKVDANKLELERVQFSPVALVEGQLDILIDQANRKGISLLGFVDPTLPPLLWGDPGRLGQIILNLLSNAIKFTSKGDVVVRVSAPQTERLRVEVQDAGIGIEPATQARLFQPFTQADNTTARRFGGTGLGLAISKRLVDLMQGQIGVHSIPGAGATFWFEVPMLRVATEEVDRSLIPLRRRDISALRALVVEHDPIALDIVCAYLKAWGLTPVGAADATQALSRLREAREAHTPFELVLVTRDLPQVDGPALAQQILAMHLSPDVAPSLVLVTAVDRAHALADYRRAGFSACLTKPVKQSQLFDCIAALGSGGVPAIAPPHRDETPAARPSRRKHILVAEDNAVNQLLVIKQLEKLGHNCHVVGNGREAVEAVGRIPYDLLLIDCQMPEMDGYEAVRRIRDQETASQRRRLPILALTANAMQGDAERCIEAGMDGHLSKPLRRDQLAEALDRWL